MPSANDAARNIDPARVFESMQDIPHAWSQMFDLWRRMAQGAAASAVSAGAAPFGAGRLTSDATSDPQALPNFMAHAYMTVMTCGLRCLSGWAHIHSRYLGSMGPGISAVSGGASQQDQMLMLDQLRGYVRELMELPYHECRRALDDLQALESSVLPQAGADDHPRRWKAKP